MSAVSLPEFLLARYAEVEATWRLPLGSARRAGKTHALEHLADVEAKRRIVDLHTPTHTCVDTKMTPPGFTEAGPCPTLRALALPFADHPDYRQEWKP